MDYRELAFYGVQGLTSWCYGKAKTAAFTQVVKNGGIHTSGQKRRHSHKWSKTAAFTQVVTQLPPAHL
jgi:hypothetical protein